MVPDSPSHVGDSTNTGRPRRALTFGLLLGTLLPATLLLSACYLRNLIGNVIYVNDIGEEVNEIIDTVFSDSTAAVCLPTDFGFYECTYIVGGEIITSTFYLLSEFGLFGIVIDPVILQAPINVVAVGGTVDNGAGPQPLLVRQGLSALPIDSHTTLTAEPGQEIIVLDLPPGVGATLPAGNPTAGAPLTFTLTITHIAPFSPQHPPVELKAIFAARVDTVERTYYPPVFPCVTSFAEVPAFTIPTAAQPVDLLPGLASLVKQAQDLACDHQSYTFATNATRQLSLPLVSR